MNSTKRCTPSFRRLFPPATERQRQAHLDQAETHNKGHGRQEHRCLLASTRLAGHLDWPGFAQACYLERTVRSKGQETHEVAYAITSAPRPQASASELLAWSRGHWGIESHHWIRDVVFGEDGCRVKKGNAPQVLAALRNAAVNFLRLSGLSEITKNLRQNAVQVDRLLTKLGIVDL
jgi:predicted transposase YbfD/YdcC